MNLCFLDTETTGLDEGRLVQLAYKTPAKTADLMFKPPKFIEFGAMGIHHITNEMVADKDLFRGSQAQPELQEILNTHVLVAHNAKFDIQVLEREGIKVPFYICSKKIAEIYFDDTDSYSLQALRYALGVQMDYDLTVAHNAMGDVNLLEAVFMKLFTLVRTELGEGGQAGFEPSEKEVITRMVNDTTNPMVLKTFRFGQYYGKSIADIAQSDIGYLKWLLKKESEKKEEEQNPDMIFTLKHYTQ